LEPLANRPLRAPLLSLEKMISVLSRSFFFSSAATMRPTWSSRAVIMAA
jgi:hypothetical protein